MGKFDILPKFHGMAIYDGLKSYFTNDEVQHSLYNEHHRRELEFIGECYLQDWVSKFVDLLKEINKAVDLARITQSCLGETQLSDFNRRYDELVDEGLMANLPPDELGLAKKNRGPEKHNPSKNLLDRLHNYKSAVLALMNDFNVPFNNHQAERDIRMIKVKQKVSGCFYSDRDVIVFCQIRSCISTVRKNQSNVFGALRLALAGTPFLPISIHKLPA